MKTYFLVQNLAGLKTDLSHLYNESYMLVLICSPKCEAKLSPSNRKLFSNIHLLDDFSTEHLTQIIKPYLSNEISLLTTDEHCMELLARLRDDLNIAGPDIDITELFTDKTAMKACLADSSIRMPKYVKFEPQQFTARTQQYLEEIVTTVGLPLIIKPIDMAGSKEVTFCRSKEDFSRWVKNDFRADISYEIDEFIEGDIYHCDALVKNGVVLYAEASLYAYPVMQFLQGKPLMSTAIAENGPLRQRIIQFNKTVISHMPSPDGATHLEVFHTNKDELIFLEIAARPPGAHVIQVYEKATGVNFELWHFGLQMDIGVDVKATKKGFSAWVYYPIIPGKVIAKHEPNLSCKHEKHWLVTQGDKLTKCHSLFDVALIVIIFSRDKYQFMQDYHYLKTFVPFTVKECK